MATTIVKSELITNLAKKLEAIQEKVIAESVNFLLEHMSDALSNGKRIEVRGFGNFSLHFRPPRNAHNPKTGQRLITTAKHHPHFKPGKELRERINEDKK